MEKIRSILKSERISSESRWYHQQKKDITKIFNRKGILLNMKDKVRSNLCYSLQYLEFLEIQLQELVLDDVLKKMIRKSFIIETMGIVEVLLVEVLRFEKITVKKQDLYNYIQAMKESNCLNLSEVELEELDGLRELRNRVHLSKLGNNGETNWDTFTEKDYKKAKKSLHTILCSSKLENSSAQRYIKFLEVK